jgi:hypothetical protein
MVGAFNSRINTNRQTSTRLSFSPISADLLNPEIMSISSASDSTSLLTAVVTSEIPKTFEPQMSTETELGIYECICTCRRRICLYLYLYKYSHVKSYIYKYAYTYVYTFHIFCHIHILYISHLFRNMYI